MSLPLLGSTAAQEALGSSLVLIGHVSMQTWYQAEERTHRRLKGERWRTQLSWQTSQMAPTAERRQQRADHALDREP